MSVKHKINHRANGHAARSGARLEHPGREYTMGSQPVFVRTNYRGADKLLGKAALITGGDSGIGRAVAIAFAKEGADVAIIHREEDKDAQETAMLVQQEGRRCIPIRGDLGDAAFCRRAVEQVVKALGRLDILVNNAAEQHVQNRLEDISEKQLVRTFQTNIFGIFFLTQAALPHLRKRPGASIINTASVVAYRGNKQLIDYASTKGAIVAFTRSLSGQLAEANIRVNAVAPGPIWTPLIPSTFPDEKVDRFGKGTPLGRAGQPWECAGAYVFLASEDATYITGETIHVNGGEVVNS